MPNSSETDSDVLHLEAESFDNQIVERIRNGHIPDLRRATKCEWFYNNVWRDPVFARLDFGQISERIDQAIRQFAGDRARVLEVGCGPGQISLELARLGHDVTGIDLSPIAIDVAQRFASEDPWKAERGGLSYIAGDFLADERLEIRSFDAVVYVGALHHFPDQQAVGSRSSELLKSKGLLVAHEPTRDRVTRGHAGLFHLLRTLLSLGGGYYEETTIPLDETALSREVSKIFSDLRYESEEGEKKQSPNDNEAGYVEMVSMLRHEFDEIILQDTYGFFHEMIGGLRFDDETNHKLARYLRDMDALMVQEKFLPATEFFFVGRSRG